MAAAAEAAMHGIFEQFPGILLTEATIEGRQVFSNDKEILRIKFRIWPNRGQPIETNFVKSLGADLKAINDEYQEWMISVFYEVEKKLVR